MNKRKEIPAIRTQFSVDLVCWLPQEFESISEGILFVKINDKLILRVVDLSNKQRLYYHYRYPVKGLYIIYKSRRRGRGGLDGGYQRLHETLYTTAKIMAS